MYVKSFLSAVAVVTSLLVTDPANAKDLLFYSSVPRNLSDQLVKTFETKNPGTHVTMFQSGAEALLEKIDLEVKARGKPDADVVWIQDEPAMRRLARDGLLDRYTPPGADKIPDVFKDKDGFYIATFIAHVLIMYNTREITGDAIPKRWADLTAPKFKEQLIFADPNISGTGAVVASALKQNLGWGFWQKIAANAPMVASGHPAMVSTVIAGERPVAAMEDFSIIAAQKQGQPVAFVFPEEGTIAVPAFAAVVHGTAAPDEARKFVAFLASKRGAEVLRAANMYSSRTDAKPPSGWPAMIDIKTLPIDWEQYRKDLGSVKEKFSSLMGG